MERMALVVGGEEAEGRPGVFRAGSRPRPPGYPTHFINSLLPAISMFKFHRSSSILKVWTVEVT